MHTLLLHLFDIIWVSNIYSHLNLLIMELFKRDFQLRFVLILFVLLFASSCGDDELEESDGIVGKWMLKEMKMELRMIDDGVTIISNGVGTNNNPENYLMFKDDNTFNEKSRIEMTFKGSANGKEHNYVQTVGSEMPEQGKWSIKGDKITFTGGGETVVYSIQTLNKSTLKLYADHAASGATGGEYFRMTLVYSRL